jgi:hypothetical protein
VTEIVGMVENDKGSQSDGSIMVFYFHFAMKIGRSHRVNIFRRRGSFCFLELNRKNA